MKKNKKLLALVCCLALLVGAAGATLAYLADKTQEVKNTFSTTDIEIELNETGASGNGDQVNDDYDLIPGSTFAKDPIVTVKANSLPCYLFVTVEKSARFDEYLTLPVDEDPNAWIKLEETVDRTVYYRLVGTSTVDQTFCVLEGMGDGEFKNGYVTVKASVTNAMLEAIVDEKVEAPSVAFKAYAVQQANLSVEAAWTQAQNADNYAEFN